jgi:hypothetical protein
MAVNPPQVMQVPLIHLAYDYTVLGQQWLGPIHVRFAETVKSVPKPISAERVILTAQRQFKDNVLCKTYVDRASAGAC